MLTVLLALFVRVDGMLMQLTDGPCRHPAIMQRVSSDVRFTGGIVYLGKREIAMCWTRSGDHLLIVDEDGDTGAIPMRELRISNGV